jgi:hypothetical protein
MSTEEEKASPHGRRLTTRRPRPIAAAFEREEKAALAYRDAWTAGARDARDEAGTAPAVS